MSWHAASLPGSLPFWSCDSCRTVKEKQCAITWNVRSTLTAAKLVYEPKEGESGFKAQARVLTPIFSAIERACPYSAGNVEKTTREATVEAQKRAREAAIAQGVPYV